MLLQEKVNYNKTYNHDHRTACIGVINLDCAIITGAWQFIKFWEGGG